MDAEE
jgi:hypothetical protein